MLPLEQAQAIVLASVSPLPSERMDLLDALGCVLAEDVSADIDLPPFDNSAMDGYAVIAADTEGAAAETPAVLNVIGDIPAGAVMAQRVLPGFAARIMTGAPVPEGADAVVRVEDTRPGAEGTVEILAPVQRGTDIRPAGEDIARGAPALERGRVLGPGEVGLLAALGRATVLATRRPLVSLVITGSELAPPGAPLPPGAIYNSNQPLLAARLLAAGCRLGRSLHVADDAHKVEQALQQCADSDLILTTGGVSVGDYDYVKLALERLGDIKFWRVLMKPGKPVAFGSVMGRPTFGLPGNPISALVTFELLVAPALRAMKGRSDCLPPTIEATVLADIRHKPGRREFRQALTSPESSGFVARPSPKRGSAMLTSLTDANSLIVIPEQSTGIRAGEKATVIFPAYGD